MSAWRARTASSPATAALYAPGCTSFRNLHDHHIVFRSAGGSNDLANRTTLCAWHHLRGVHAGVVRCTGVAPDALRFALGVRRDGAAVVVYGAGEVVVASESLRRENLRKVDRARP